jgi:transposase
VDREGRFIDSPVSEPARKRAKWSVSTPASGSKAASATFVTDTLGLMLRIEVHSAGVQDRAEAALVLDRITRRFPFIERFFADAGYQGPRVAEAAPRPVEIINRTGAGFVVQPRRWVIERTFACACINRRLARESNAPRPPPEPSSRLP